MHHIRGSAFGKTLRAFIILPIFWISSAAAQPARQTGSQTETLDRVIATIRGVPYTQSDLVREYKLETFLSNGRVPAGPVAAEALASTLPRLVDQKLLEGELGAYHFDSNSIELRARQQMAALRKKFRSEQDFQNALGSLGMSESQLMKRIENQEKILDMIDTRLRPAASVNAKDITDYYHKTLLPALARENKDAQPSLAQAESKIREILIQKKINQLLNEWLMELRKERQVEILGN